MELLKKQFGIILLILIAQIAVAQTTTEIQSAFTLSYTYESGGEYGKAIDEIKKVYSEDNYEINIRLGWLNYEAGHFTVSISYYQKAISLKPYSIEAKFGIVYPAAAAGNWDQVILHYNEILKIEPKNSVVNYRLGVIYYERKDYKKSFEYLENVVNLYPFDYDGLIMFAWCNYQLGNTREAKVLFNKVLLLSPNDSSAKEGLGLLK
ncbi:MAG: tetratricopeptide repeat protein [Bacteroidota bacterium]